LLELKLWEKVQALFEHREEKRVAQPSESLLIGKIFCSACRSAMTPSHTSRVQTRRYRYYVCTQAQRRGWNSCPSKSLPAGQLEGYVMDQLRGIAVQSIPLETSSHEDLPFGMTPLWNEFIAGSSTSNQGLFKVLQHTIDRVEYHGGTREITVTYHQDRIHELIRGSQC